jgi:hypothetical protein
MDISEDYMRKVNEALLIVKDLESTMIVIEWVYPIISAGFFIIVSLLIYIWKTNTARTDTILEQTNKTLEELRMITAVQGNDIENIKGKIFHS